MSRLWPSLEPQHADEEAADIMQREHIRIAADTIGITLDDDHVTAVQWELSGILSTWHVMWRISKRIDNALVATVTDAVRWTP